MTYLIISLIFLVIAFGCFRNYSKGNIVPTCAISFLISSVLSAIVYTVDFKMHPEKHKFEAREINHDPGEVVFEGKKIWIGEESIDLSEDTPVKKDNVSFIKEIILKETYKMPSGMIDVVLKKNIRKVLYLSKKDYELYSAYKDSLDKRN